MNEVTLLSGVTEFRTGKTVTVVLTTPFRFMRPCVTCGVSQGRMEGIPDTFQVKIPITDNDLMRVYNKPFWITVNFDIMCNNTGYHRIKGLPPVAEFVVSELPAWDQGYYEKGSHFESVLAKFLPNFMGRKLIYLSDYRRNSS